MRLIPTGSPEKIAIIAATKRELSRLKTYKHLTQFNGYITTEPHLNQEYDCYLMVYTFESGPQARLFRLAYSLALRRFKHVYRAYPSRTKRSPSYYKARKAATRKRRLHRQRKRTKTRYLKLIPLLKAGKVRELEAKAREIARINTISDLI